MKKITFIADGQTKVFHFTFPFFLKTDVIIEVDSQPATNYNLICTKNGLNADIPFSGGQVHFNKPPKTASVITIKRKIPVKRIVDYQPTAQYDARTHNQDMNYVLEILKDMQDGIDILMRMPSDATNAEAITTLSQQIAQIISTIDELRQSDEPLDLSDIYTNIDSLTSSVNALNTRCNQLENMPSTTLPENIDYVVQWQNPTNENNHTWYRKYASGWIEQGGQANLVGATPVHITLPIEMNDAYYQYTLTPDVAPVNNSTPVRKCTAKTTTGFDIIGTYASAGQTFYDNIGCLWTVCGMFKQ